MFNQTIFEFYRTHKERFYAKGCTLRLSIEEETLTIKYPSGSTHIIRGTDFPHRNQYPVFRIENGKSVFDHWEDDIKTSHSFISTELAPVISMGVF